MTVSYLFIVALVRVLQVPQKKYLDKAVVEFLKQLIYNQLLMLNISRNS
jgi:hypothetical protein